jgi:3',5'-cyclic AMP phosphodiesterase CpdA
MAPPRANATPRVLKLTIKDPTAFRILQVTDLHLIEEGYRLDHSIIDRIGKIVARFKPDIIVNTGDFWGTNSLNAFQRSCQAFAELRTPWAFAWGNHDEAPDYNQFHTALEKTPYLLYSGAADGNYRIEVQAKTDNSPLWNLIVMNNSRGGFRADQIDWFKAEAERIKHGAAKVPPAFLFFHVPLPQYGDLVTSRKAIGAWFEPVCDEDGSREALTAFRNAGFVKATFCGHDHTNDFHGVVDGIWLQYGRSAGGSGHPKVPKGGTLITVDTTKQTFAVQSVLPDGSAITYDTLMAE